MSLPAYPAWPDLALRRADFKDAFLAPSELRALGNPAELQICLFCLHFAPRHSCLATRIPRRPAPDINSRLPISIAILTVTNGITPCAI